MLNSIKYLSILLFLLLFENDVLGGSVKKTFVTLWAGTVVSFQLDEEIDGMNITMGIELDFKVRSNVVVNGQVVIATGALAVGRIKRIRRKCDSYCAEVVVVLNRVQAVDGQQIYLRSTPSKLIVDCCRGDGVIPIGAKVSAYTLNDTKIDA